MASERASRMSSAAMVKLMLVVPSPCWTFWMMSSTTRLASAMRAKMEATRPAETGAPRIVTRVRSFLRAAPRTTMCSIWAVSLDDEGSLRVVEAVADVDDDIVVLGELDGASA